jgi:hypothetical protein
MNNKQIRISLKVKIQTKYKKHTANTTVKMNVPKL